MPSRIASGAIALAASLFQAGDHRSADKLPGDGTECRTMAENAARPALSKVTWVLVPDSGIQKVLNVWCRTVGPAVVEQDSSAHDAIADSIPIITWNTHVGGGDIAALVSDLRTGRVTGKPQPEFVLLLQEAYRSADVVPDSLFGIGVPGRIEIVPPSGKRVDIVQSSHDVALNLFYVPSMRNGAPPFGAEDRGNAILSSMRLYDPAALELPFETQRRVALVGSVRGQTSEGTPWQIVVSSVHLDTRGPLTRPWRAVGGSRREQAVALVHALPPAQATVVAGDLNTWAFGFSESAVPYLRSQFGSTPAATVGNTFEAGLFKRRLDYMFFKLPEGWSARYRRLDSRYGSDHYPLLAWVRIAPDTAAGASAGP